jgi:hypothetical protein
MVILYHLRQSGCKDTVFSEIRKFFFKKFFEFLVEMSPYSSNCLFSSFFSPAANFNSSNFTLQQELCSPRVNALCGGETTSGHLPKAKYMYSS